MPRVGGGPRRLARLPHLFRQKDQPQKGRPDQAVHLFRPRRHRRHGHHVDIRARHGYRGVRYAEDQRRLRR